MRNSDPQKIKVLVCSALICFVELGKLSAWMVILIISREFIISGFRLIAADNGIVIAASYWGKFKTTFQMVMIVLLIADLPGKGMFYLTQGVIWIALGLTIISLLDYLMKNRTVMADGMK